MGDATVIGSSIYLLHNVGRHVLQIVRSLAERRVDGQQKVLAEHSLDDVFRRTHHVVVFMTALNLGQHHLIDVEGLVDDPDLLAGLFLIPFREFCKNILVNVVSPVVNLQNLLPVLLVVAGRELQNHQQAQEKKSYCLDSFNSLNSLNSFNSQKYLVLHFLFLLVFF